MTGFRAFIARGNVVDLAIAVVIGAAFGAVVTSLVEDIVTPSIAAIGGEPDFSRLAFSVNGSRLRYGEFLNALFAFLIVAAVLYFGIVRPIGALLERLAPAPPDAPRRDCPECLSRIPAAATRCAFCTAAVEPA